MTEQRIDTEALRREALGQLGRVAADPRWPGRVLALLDLLAAAEAERDEWRQTALDERGAALDALEQVKARDARIKAVRDMCDAEEDPDQWPPRPVMHGGEPFPATLYVEDIRRALDGDA